MPTFLSTARKVLVASMAVCLGAVGLITLATSPASAGPGCAVGTIEVTTNTDAALRAAFTAANGVAGPSTICVNTGVGTISMAAGELLYDAGVGDALTLVGNGVIIDGFGTTRVLRSVAPVTLNGVTITGGGVEGGAGLFVDGSATLINSTIRDNTSASGAAGVFASSPVTLTNSTISGNTATGASGIGGLTANTVTLTNSTVSGNTATGASGIGGVNGNGNATFTNSTVSGNAANNADGLGTGGLHINGNVTIANSTVSGNVGGTAGGVWVNGDATVTNSTVSGNTADIGPFPDRDGGMHVNGAATLVYATVVQNSGVRSGNVWATGDLTTFGSVIAQAAGGGPNCVVPLTMSNGYNLSDDASAAVSCKLSAGTDLVGPAQAPTLGTLANNGGPTMTRLPLAGSALLNAIPLASCQADGASGITTDQRGFARPAFSGCDIGAVEVQPTPDPDPDPDPDPTPQAPAATPTAAAPSFTG